MKFLLDTCTISDFVKGDSNTLEQFKRTSPTDIALSSITIMEVHYGLALNPSKARIIKPMFIDLLASVVLLNFESEDAFEAAKIRAHLKQQGKLIGAYDILLAAIALRHNLIFVTSNTNEFNRVDDLILANWRLN